MMAASRTKAPDELTPEARKQRGEKLIEAGIGEIVKARLAALDWVDQHHSPLKKRVHLELARSGKVPSRKIGAQVFIRVEDLNAYIDKHGLARGRREADEDEDEIIERVTRNAGGTR
jgi:hypothetical protein